MTLDQSQTPLADALQICAHRRNAPFHTPGHKRGQGISKRHSTTFGHEVFRADLPELPDLDNLFAPEGVIQEAQMLAAEAFGAEQTYFLANGSTCGIEAAILAVCGPGEKIIVPRNAHSSVISGLVLSGAEPVYVSPAYDLDWDMAAAVDPAAIATTLSQHPDAKAVLVVSPTYYGITSDIQAIAHLTHKRNIPLIVDEAHGPHFAFHPDLPTPALAAGADIAIQSAHKVLSAFTQAALLHTQGNRFSSTQIKRALQLTQSTSPSYLLLGSLDAARHQMATNGKALMKQTLQLADRAAHTINQIDGLRVLQGCDRTRLTIDVSGIGLTGFQADEILHEHFNVTVELPGLRHLMFIITLGNTNRDIDTLIDACQRLKQHAQPHSKANIYSQIAQPQPADDNVLERISPRHAFFSAHTALPIEQAKGYLCAETICPYPPGIPTLLPGEPITKEAIAYLQAIMTAGGIITGCADPTLQTIQIVKP